MCTCHDTAPHVLARRPTADGHPVELYSDGYVTGPVGYLLPGVGRRRLPEGRLWAFASEVCLFARAELGGLVTEHQRAAKLDAARVVTELHPFAIAGHRSLYPTRRR